MILYCYYMQKSRLYSKFLCKSQFISLDIFIFYDKTRLTSYHHNEVVHDNAPFHVFRAGAIFIAVSPYTNSRQPKLPAAFDLLHLNCHVVSCVFDEDRTSLFWQDAILGFYISNILLNPGTHLSPRLSRCAIDTGYTFILSNLSNSLSSLFSVQCLSTRLSRMELNECL